MDVALSSPQCDRERRGIQPFKAWSLPTPKRPRGAPKRSVTQDLRRLRTLRPGVIALARSERAPNEMMDRTCAQ
jgi:hypothetical protein